MKSILTGLLIIGTFLSLGQNDNLNWTVQPFSDLGFAEDLGRHATFMEEDVQYFAQYSRYKIFFSNDAFIFVKPGGLSKEEAHERFEKMEHGEAVKPLEWEYFKIEFQNTNLRSEIIAKDLKHHTRNFQGSNGTIKARTFDYLIYKNLYPNIDVKLELPKEGGLKYSFHVHPGGDYKNIEMLYSAANIELDENGNLLIDSFFGSSMDKAPRSFVDEKEIQSKFNRNGNKISFLVDKYDNSEELIIDPWVVIDLPPGILGLDVSSDNAGNCTVLVAVESIIQEVLLYDNTGALQWTWASVVFGDISMNPISGDTYVISHYPHINRLNPLGILDATIDLTILGSDELWRVKYSEYHNKVTIGEGGPWVTSEVHISLLNPDLTIYEPHTSFPDISSGMEDCVLFEIDPVDGSFYFAVAGKIGGLPSLYGDQLYKFDADDPTIPLWNTFTNHGFQETNTSTYYSYSNGVNGIACGENYVYTYDGNKIIQYDKMTGDLMDSLFFGVPVFSQYGLDTDECGNLYVGTADSVLIFSENLTPIGSFEIPETSYDLYILNSAVYISGNDFLTSVDLNLGDFSIAATDVPCEACVGTAAINPESCHTFESVVWSPGGGTEATITDLCPGWYTATVTWIDGDGYEFVTVDSVEVTSGDGLGLSVATFNQPTCYGFTDGSITVEVADGLEDITYTWDPINPIDGATYNNVGAGTYVVYATDDESCSDSLVIVINQPDSLFADITIIDPLCYGDSTGYVVVNNVFNAQGDLDNISYFWTPNYFGEEGVGVDSAYLMPQGEYSLTINDDFGCSQVIDFTINQPDELVFSEFGYHPAFCRQFGYQSGNGVVFAAAIGGVADYNYTWVNLTNLDETANSTWGGLNPGPYQITITDNNGCQLIETLVIDSLNPIAAFEVVSDQLNVDCEGTELVFVEFINQSENFANPNNPLADTTFLWNLNHALDEWTISHDFFHTPDTSYIGEAIYEVCLIALNQNGCADKTCKNIIVHVQPEFIAPNIFTPGGNGVNDLFTFEFTTVGIETFHCTIVNRWGRTIAELNHITDSWNGTDLQGDDCVNGVYFYSYQAVSTNNTTFNGQGNVQLVRR